MNDTIKEHLDKLSDGEKLYASTIIPLWLSFTIYMMIGIPIIMP